MHKGHVTSINNNRSVRLVVVGSRQSSIGPVACVVCVSTQAGSIFSILLNSVFHGWLMVAMPEQMWPFKWPSFWGGKQVA